MVMVRIYFLIIDATHIVWHRAYVELFLAVMAYSRFSYGARLYWALCEISPRFTRPLLRNQYSARNLGQTTDEKRSLLAVNAHRSPSLTLIPSERRPFAEGLLLLLLICCPIVWAKTSRLSDDMSERRPFAEDLTVVLPKVTVIAKARGAKQIGTDPFTGDQVGTLFSTGMDTAQSFRRLPGVSVTGDTRPVSQFPIIQGLSGNQILLAVDEVPVAFSSFGHYHAMQLLPPAALFKTVAVQTPGNSVWGSGAEGGILTARTLEPADYLLPGQAVGAEFSPGFQTGAPGFNTSLAIFAQQTGIQALLKIIGDRFKDMYLANHQRLPFSARQGLHYLAKLVINPVANHQFVLSAFSLQNWGRYPTVPSRVVSKTNPPADVHFQQQQQQLSYTWQPDHPGFDVKAKLYHLSRYRSILPASEANADMLPQAITLETIGFDLQNTATQAWHITHYGLQASIQTGWDRYHSDTLFNYPERLRATQVAGFLQTQLGLTAKLKLLTGLRWDHAWYTQDTSTRHMSHWNRQLGFIYQLTPGLNIYARYAEAFRYPTLDEQYLGGAHPHVPGVPVTILLIPNPALKPETSVHQEIGFNLSQANVLQAADQLKFKVSLFLKDIQHYINYVLLPSEGRLIHYQQQNIGAAYLRGTTLSLQYQWPNEQTTLYATASMIHGYHAEDYFGLSGRKVPAGTRLPFVVPLQATLGTTLAVPALQAQLHLQLRAASAQPRVPHQFQAVSGYTVWDLHYRWMTKVPGLEVLFVIENLTNRHYAVYSVPAIHGEQQPFPAMGRNISLMMRYRF